MPLPVERVDPREEQSVGGDANTNTKIFALIFMAIVWLCGWRPHWHVLNLILIILIYFRLKDKLSDRINGNNVNNFS